MILRVGIIVGICQMFQEAFANLSGGGSDFGQPDGRFRSLDLTKENWRHERPKLAAIGGTKEKPDYTNVGDPVGSGIALANGVAYFTTLASNKLVALNASTGAVLKEIQLGPTFCGPSVSRGRVYVGMGNLLFAGGDPAESYYPKSMFGGVICFGLPGEPGSEPRR